jgi:hypothetical protein
LNFLNTNIFFIFLNCFEFWTILSLNFFHIRTIFRS